jgi:phosphatidylglycerophosphate synthase
VDGIDETAGRRQTYKQAVRQLAAAQKSNRGAGGYSRWINRPIGRRFAAAGFCIGLTPNQISILSAVFSYAAIATLATFRPTWLLATCVAVALLVGYALDSADGQVARLRGGGSASGEWLDHVIDALKISALHIAVLICWYRFYETSDGVLFIAAGFAIVGPVFYFAITLSDLLRRIGDLRRGGTGKPTSTVDRTEPAPVLRSLIVLPNDYGVLALSMILLAAHTVFVWVYGLMLAANALFLAAGCVRWFLEMQRLDRAPASNDLSGSVP